jgi:glycosyltransferase involved in cell wall biosynthesis
LRPPLGQFLLRRVVASGDPDSYSANWLPSGWARELNASRTDLLHLHWLNGEMISIAEIGRLRKPLVWTLHDMWAFCGAEHYSEGSRWREGYRRDNRPAGERGFDIHRSTWQRKRRHWRHPSQLVTPSRWLAECVRASALMRDWPVTVIPNALDTASWQPVEKVLARGLLGLPADVPLLLFGAIGGDGDPRKGFDLLQEALRLLRSALPGLRLIVFGKPAPAAPPDLGFPVHYIGHLHDDLSLRVLYSAAAAMIVPSRLEAFGQTASEAHACGTPVVAFDNSGIADIVDHRRTGYLARALDTADLADGIRWVLSDPARHGDLCRAARVKAVTCFDAAIVAARYAELYGQVLAGARR